VPFERAAHLFAPRLIEGAKADEVENLLLHSKSVALIGFYKNASWGFTSNYFELPLCLHDVSFL